MTAREPSVLPQDDEIMAELESGNVFDDRRVPIDRRVAIIRQQLIDWNEVAYNTKVAFQTNRAIGVQAEDLAPLIAQFTRARAAISDLEQRLAELESEAGARTTARSA